MDGTEFDNSRVRGQTLNFEVGSGRMIPGFDAAVVGMTVGDTQTVTLQPEDAYGTKQPDALRPAGKDAFGENFEFVIGEVVQGNGPEGSFLATIREINDDHVILDLNHPLAGEILNFEIEVMAIHNASEDIEVTMANWNTSMKKAELLEVAKSRGLPVNTKSTKAQIIEALSA